MGEEQLTTEELINNAIAEALAGPRRASGDAGEVESHSLESLIKMKQFLSSGATAASNKRRGLRFTRFVPDGSMGGVTGHRFSW